MSRDFFQTGQLLCYQMVKQSLQRLNLRAGIGICHLLPAGLEPARIAAVINQFYTNTLRVKGSGVVGDAVQWDPLFNTAITVNIKMPAIPGLALLVNLFLSPYPRHGQIGQLGTMNDHQLDAFGAATFQTLRIRQ